METKPHQYASIFYSEPSLQLSKRPLHSYISIEPVELMHE